MAATAKKKKSRGDAEEAMDTFFFPSSRPSKDPDSLAHFKAIFLGWYRNL